MFYLSKKQDIFRLKPHLLHLKQKFVFDWNTPTGEASAETPGMGGGAEPRPHPWGVGCRITTTAVFSRNNRAPAD